MAQLDCAIVISKAKFTKLALAQDKRYIKLSYHSLIICDVSNNCNLDVMNFCYRESHEKTSYNPARS